MNDWSDRTGMWNELPHGIHATVLTGRDVVSGLELVYPVAWADRSYRTCPRCRQPVDRVPACPVALNTGAGAGGQLEELSQQHGCGEWLAVDWAEADEIEGVPATAQRLADRLVMFLDAERTRLRAGLITQLRDALTRLAEPLDVVVGEAIEDRRAEVETGSEVDPGVYLDDRWADRSEWVWCAWDFDPDGSGETVAVYVEDLTVTQVSG